MFYRYEHYMSISHIALIVNMVHNDVKIYLPEIKIRINSYIIIIKELILVVMKTKQYFSSDNKLRKIADYSWNFVAFLVKKNHHLRQ